MQLTLCTSTIDVVQFLSYSVPDSQPGRSVNTTQGQEVSHSVFPDRFKRTAGLVKPIAETTVQAEMCRLECLLPAM